MKENQMNKKYFLATTAALSMTAAMPALALTPEEAWDNWLLQTADLPGLTVTYEDPASAGGGLSVRDMTITAVEGEDTFSVRVPELMIMPDGADAVMMTLPGNATLSLSVENMDADFALDGENLSFRAMEGDGSTSSSVRADSLTVSLVEMLMDGKPMEAAGKMDIRNLAFETEMTDRSGSTTSFSYGGISGSGEAKSVSGDQTASLSFLAGPVQSLMKIGGLEQVEKNGEDFSGALRGGFSLNAQGLSEGGEYRFSSNGVEQPAVKMSASWGQAKSAMKVDRNGMMMAGDGGDVTIMADGAGDKFDLKLPKYEYGMTVPLLKNEKAQKAGILMGFHDMQPNLKSNMVPPQIAEMVNNPITVSIDIEADVMLEQDLVSEEVLEYGSAGPAFDIIGLRLNDMTLIGAGSAAIASGVFDFPMGMSSVDESNIPAGNVDVELRRIPELFEALQAMGLASPDIGMMLMMVQGVAVEGPDGSMVFKVESKDGRVSVNGNRIR